ncbi:unnamed protein product [Symbiodinium sp. CCMP2592]|nr:unnamed protein product [Symbiodinium sp. CCMP2592]
MAAPGDFVSLTVRLVDRSRTVEKAWQGTTYLSVWHLGRDVGMLELSSLNGRGYLFTHDGRRWSNLIHPNLRLSDVGVKEGSVVEFSGDFDKSAGTPLILQVHLMDRSKTTEEFGAVLPEACVWDLGMSLGMEKLSTLGGYIFSFEGRRWKSLEHPSLTFAEVVGGGFEGQELLVAFEGDFTRRDLPSSDAEVTLSVVLMDKSKSKTVSGRARRGDSVWKFGLLVGMASLTTSSRSQGGYVFRRQGGESYRERLYPDLTIAAAGVKDGDTVEFSGDFDVFEPTTDARTDPGTAVTLTVVLMDKSKSRTVTGRAKMGDSVWKFGEEVGMATLSTMSKYIFRRQGGESYKERMYPNLTLADVGVREGDTVEFAGDFDPVAPAPGARADAGTAATRAFLQVTLTVVLMDKSKSRTVTGLAKMGDSVWKFGEEVGMTTLSTMSKYIFRRQGGESYKERMYPNLTLADVGVLEGDTVEFAGDFDPVAPAPGARADAGTAATRAFLQVTLTVVLMDKSKSRTVTGRAKMGDSVWKFGEEVGMATLSTMSKYIFRRQGGESYKERMYPNLTLADVGVLEGDTVEFAGDFDPVAPAPGARADAETAATRAFLQVTLTVVLMDKSKSRTVTGRAKMGDSVWKFGKEVGMTTLTTHSRSQGGYVFKRQGGESYRERLYPHLTLADVGVREGDTVEFSGDFDVFEPKA